MSYQVVVGQYDFEDGTFQGLATFAEANGSVDIAMGGAHAGVYSSHFTRLVNGGMAIASVPLGLQDNFVWDGWFKISTLPQAVYEKIRVMRVYDARGEVDGKLFDIMAMRISDGSTRLYATNLLPGTNVNLGVNATANTWIHLTIAVNQGVVQVAVNGVTTPFSVYWGGDNYQKLHIGCLWSDLPHESYFDDIVVSVLSEEPPPVYVTVSYTSSPVPVAATINGQLLESGVSVDVEINSLIEVTVPNSVLYEGGLYNIDAVYVNGVPYAETAIAFIADADTLIQVVYILYEEPPPPTRNLTLSSNVPVEVEVNGVLYNAGTVLQVEEGSTVVIRFPASILYGGLTYNLTEVFLDGTPISTDVFSFTVAQNHAVSGQYTEEHVPPPPPPTGALLLVGGAVLYLAMTRR